MVQVPCDNCGKLLDRFPSEIGRRGGKTFCSRSCSAVSGNLPRRSKEIVKTCPFCQTRFTSTTHNKAASFCSRSCASRGSLTEERLAAQSAAGKAHAVNLLSPVETLKLREAWKYVALEASLQGRDYEFEYELGGYVFDLALKDTKVIVEFDGKAHNDPRQREIDAEKDVVAREAGFNIVRRCVEEMKVISTAVLDGL